MVDKRLNDDILDFLKRDDHATNFLNIAYNEGGSADVKTLRYELGLSSDDNNVLNYRFRKLEENDLIDIEYDKSITRGNRSPAKVAVLTDLGKEVVQSDLVEPSKDIGKEPEEISLNKNDLEELKEEYEKTQNRLDMIEEKIKNSEIEKTEEIEKRLKNIESNLDPEYMNQWMTTAQNYLEAIRNYLEMQEGVDLEEYLENQEEEQQNVQDQEDDFEYIE